MKRALLSTVFAWIVGIIAFMTLSLYATRDPTYYTADPVGEFFRELFFLAFFIGVVVFPTCLLVVTPFLRFIPRSSRVCEPGIALLIGAASGPIAMYVWAAVCNRHFYVPDIHDEGHLLLGGTSALVGATFAFSYARLDRAHQRTANKA